MLTKIYVAFMALIGHTESIYVIIDRKMHHKYPIYSLLFIKLLLPLGKQTK